MHTESRIQMLDDNFAFKIPFAEGMNQTILPNAMGEIVGKTELFCLCMETILL